jgi:hypothetical protein
MTMREQMKNVTIRGFRPGGLVGLLVTGSAWGAAALLSACGGSDVTCGKGTTKQGSVCVASSAVVNKDAGPSSGGTSGSGGSSGDAAPGTGGSSGSDAGTHQDKLVFGGITSASPANQTPPKATGAVADSVRLTWNPATFAAQPLLPIHYDIFQATTAGAENFTTPTDSAPPGSTSFVIQDLTPGTTYYFVIRAVLDDGAAVDTNVVEKSAAPGFDDSPPDFHAGVTDATAAGPTSMTVSWGPAADDQTAPEGITYRVYWTDKAGGTLELGAVSTPGATSALVTGLPTPETDYYFSAVAVDAAGNQDDNKVTVRGTTGPDTKPPVFGGCISVSDISASTATVTWAAATDDTSRADKITYTVYASDVHIDKGQSLAQLDVGHFTGQTTGQVTGLNAATLYRFVCRAKDEAGNEDTNLVIQTGATSNDGQPPTFAGVATADPSPTADETSIDLTWLQATDDQTLAKDMKYRVYVSTTAGGEDFTSATVTSAPGVLGISVSKSNLLALGLTQVSNKDFYIVVRAADGAGNVDTNKVELKVTTFVSFKDDIQPIFTDKCAIGGCHTAADPGTPPKQGQNLDEGAAYSQIVEVPAVEGATLGEQGLVRVSKSKVLINSYMYRKITGTTPFSGSTMPPAISSKGPLNDMTQKPTLILWIAQGAKDN